MAPDRAGVSVIALSSDLMGVELGFWGDRIWAQSGPSFTKAEEGLFNTTSALTSYTLQFTGTTYSLTANGVPLLTGPLRNYSSFGAPYNIPNFIFFGDDTTSARGSFRTSRITLGGAAPEPASLGLLGSGLGRRSALASASQRELGLPVGAAAHGSGDNARDIHALRSARTKRRIGHGVEPGAEGNHRE